MDSGFLNGDHNGQSLVLSARDDDNKIFVVAVALTDTENQESCCYLLENCMESVQQSGYDVLRGWPEERSTIRT